ncbi:hypothetical protein VTJ04DRAFT_1310 [Mycothermus thermophilus]|uniref:uncharacterized protein n=1 Tax=Humicola insolens TaxID=85995 RepID=UPI003743301D
MPEYQFLQTNIDYRTKKLADLQTDTRTLLNAANTSLQQGTSEAQGEVTKDKMALWELRAPNNPQKMAVAAAEDALTRWDDAEGATLKSMQDAIDAVQTGEEANAVTQAEIHLHAAESDMASVNAAAWMLQGAVKTLDAVRSVSGWVAKHSLNLLLIIKRIEVSGDLRTANLGKTQLSARIVGTFAGFNVDFSLGFIPGKALILLRTCSSS